MGIKHKIYVAIFGTFGFLLPTIGCHLLYFKTRRKLRKHESNSLEAGVHVRKQKKYIKKFDKISWTMNLIFCIGWTPYFLCSMYYVSTDHFPVYPTGMIASFLGKACVIMNPMIYLH